MKKSLRVDIVQLCKFLRVDDIFTKSGVLKVNTMRTVYRDLCNLFNKIGFDWKFVLEVNREFILVFDWEVIGPGSEYFNVHDFSRKFADEELHPMALRLIRDTGIVWGVYG